MRKEIVFALVTGLLSIFLSSESFRFGPIKPLRLKMLTITMLEKGTVHDGNPGEAELWVRNEKMKSTMRVPGGASLLYYNANGHGLTVTGMGASKATASARALGLNPHLDLRETYERRHDSSLVYLDSHSG